MPFELLDVSVELEVAPASTVAEVKEKLASVEGTPVETTRYLIAGLSA